VFSFATDYFVLIAAAFFGVLQIVAARNNLRGLSLFPNKKLGYLAGTAIAVSSFVWFFASGKRNIEGHITGVQGSQQFGLFLAGVSTSIAVTAIIASVVNWKAKPHPDSPRYGLDLIRETTFLRTFLRYFKKQG
jgi:hypothetical protein